jgi:hypothetical protein
MSPTLHTEKGYRSSVNVHSIIKTGIILEVNGEEYFLPYKTNPWFENASVSDIFNVEMCGKESVRWDSLDVDLAIESFIHPEKYPLITKRI